MIERIAIAGTDVPLVDVFASVTIRHGRVNADDPPLASTASLSIVDATRELTSSFRVADELVIETVGAVPRFVGRITDAKFSDGTLAVLAVSSLSWLARRPVGLVDYPSELWSDRVHRVLGEAGALTTWAGTDGSWASSSATWETVEEGAVVELGDVDPMLAARVADETTLGAYLAALVETNPAAIAQLPNGAILVQELTARKARPTVELEPDLVAANPEWAQVDEVTNVLDVEWSGGELTSRDELSADRFEERAESITTELLLEADAEDLGDRAVQRRAWPRWEIERAELLELDSALAIGDPVSIPLLEDGAPLPTYLGVLEGWEDSIEVGPDTDDDGELDLQWTTILNLSPPRYSGIGIAWADVPATETWADADADVTWNEPELVLAD